MVSRFPEDPMAALARLIGQDDPFRPEPSARDCRRCFAVTGVFCLDCPATVDHQGKYPKVRQVPFKYHTKAHGPVFAYQAAGRTATCLTWLDATVSCDHDELLPFDPRAEGAELIEVLDDEITEMMSPHMDGRSFKYQPPRRSTIGAYLFQMNIFNGAVHA